ncbi:MAG TPA: aminotransferase class I/II-fold pyridoxal phosphate-dependent enzyme [Gemmatimonadaceae bacterium]|nr:aminotransferase class I/II-fold pyridoxal phosphate-dependent enzyme [Gemmatimonadaceae bacterium]
MRPPHAQRTRTFTESVIREMTRIAAQHEAINLAQGFPDFPMPAPMKEAACTAIRGDINQYAVTWGASALRMAIAEKYRRWYDLDVDPDREITVTCGATEAMAAVFLALFERGDEVIILEPFYENYGPDAILAGATPVFVPLEPPHWRIDPDRLRAAFGPRTAAIVVNTPHNPTGRVLSRDELSDIAALCVEHDVWALTDEIYEHITYAGHHHPLATFPGMRERTVTISGLSKTFSCTGWRLGYAIAPPTLSQHIRKVHDFLTVGAPAPLQAAGAVGMAFDAAYYNALAMEYHTRRDLLAAGLADAGFRFTLPEGAYYILADFSAVAAAMPSDAHSGTEIGADTAFARWLTREIGVAPVPGSSFYHDPALGRTQVRFAFCKRLETLDAASRRLSALAASASDHADRAELPRPELPEAR